MAAGVVQETHRPYAGTEAFLRSSAQELGERGITLDSVAPGRTRTNFAAHDR